MATIIPRVPSNFWHCEWNVGEVLTHAWVSKMDWEMTQRGYRILRPCLGKHFSLAMTSSFANKYSPSCINDVLLLPRSCQFFSFPMESSYNAQGMSRATLLGLSGAIPYSRPYLPFYSSLFRGHFFHYFFINFFSPSTRLEPCFFHNRFLS